MTVFPRAMMLAIALVFALAVPATAARQVPYGFFGVHWGPELRALSAEDEDAQWDLMAASGVESVRVDFTWSRAQPLAGDPINFSFTDAIVKRASLRGIKLLPVVYDAPAWARAYRSKPKSPPRDSGDYAAYLAALVERYGPKGSYWTDNPDVPRLPLREWQLWNEPHLRSYWDAPERSRWGHPRGYGRLLAAGYSAIKSRDARARVVLAGLTQRAWEELEEMYAGGRIKRRFDVAALQIFPQTVRRSWLATELFRDALDARGDRRVPIYITEISWPASRGRTPRVKYLAHETPRTMAAKLGAAYGLLAQHRRALRLERVYWYTWATPYGRGGSVFNYAGLQEYRNGRFTPQPALGAFQRRARELQGCEKTEIGDCA